MYNLIVVSLLFLIVYVHIEVQLRHTMSTTKHSFVRSQASIVEEKEPSEGLSPADTMSNDTDIRNYTADSYGNRDNHPSTFLT